MVHKGRIHIDWKKANEACLYRSPGSVNPGVTFVRGYHWLQRFVLWLK
jgi:hypothetical protein